MCRMTRALYGHPESGGHWEQHCEAHLVSIGFQVIPDWPSTFWHPKWQLFLVVYVDEFKLAGKSENLQLAWARIAEGIQMDPPTKMGLFLGCEHEPFEVPHPKDKSKKTCGMVYNVMVSYSRASSATSK